MKFNKKIISFTISVFLIPILAFATIKVYPPSTGLNQNSMPVAGANSSNEPENLLTVNGVLQVDVLSGTTSVTSSVAHDAVDSGNPIKIGCKAIDPTAMSSAVASGDRSNIFCDLFGRLITYNGAQQAGEDLTADVQKVEHRYSYTNQTADTLVKSGSGFIHALNIAGITATPTGGLLTVYDNTAESGSVVYKTWVSATTEPVSIVIDVSFGTGLYIGYDGTLANVNVTSSWR